MLSLATCVGVAPPGTCDGFDASERLGTTLYNGPFNPQYQSSPPGAPPHQNFTVFVPPTIPEGAAVLTLTHLSLVGVRIFPGSEIVRLWADRVSVSVGRAAGLVGDQERQIGRAHV